MSKKLVKILSICALTVLVPLIVLAVALCVVGNQAVTLSIRDGGNSVVAHTTSEIAIFIDSQKQDSNTITVKKGTEVTVTWAGTGFQFDGWFEGNESEAQGKTPVSRENSYTFTLDDNRVLTAIKHFVSYTVHVKYNANSTQTNDVFYSRRVDELGNVTGSFGVYGLANTRSGYNFVGLEYGGHVYEKNTAGTDYTFGGASLGEALLDSDTYTIDATAVWECNYAELNLNVSTDVNSTYTVYGVKNNTETELRDLQRYFEFVDDADGYDLADSWLTYVIGDYDNYIIKDGQNSSVQLDITNVEVAIEDVNGVALTEYYTIDLTDCTTLKDFIDIIVDARGGTALTNSNSIKITFAFTKA